MKINPVIMQDTAAKDCITGRAETKPKLQTVPMTSTAVVLKATSTCWVRALITEFNLFLKYLSISNIE